MPAAGADAVLLADQPAHALGAAAHLGVAQHPLQPAREVVGGELVLAQRGGATPHFLQPPAPEELVRR
jgi:hypothetical protein